MQAADPLQRQTQRCLAAQVLIVEAQLMIALGQGEIATQGTLRRWGVPGVDQRCAIEPEPHLIVGIELSTVDASARVEAADPAQREAVPANTGIRTAQPPVPIEQLLAATGGGRGRQITGQRQGRSALGIILATVFEAVASLGHPLAVRQLQPRTLLQPESGAVAIHRKQRGGQTQLDPIPAQQGRVVAKRHLLGRPPRLGTRGDAPEALTGVAGAGDDKGAGALDQAVDAGPFARRTQPLLEFAQGCGEELIILQIAMPGQVVTDPGQAGVQDQLAVEEATLADRLAVAAKDQAPLQQRMDRPVRGQRHTAQPVDGVAKAVEGGVLVAGEGVGLALQQQL
ncbi:hypothetical protein TevJSym_ba00020 [endosymbiont of Tevnia jerichonana (vent Tica)]|uniref:Uncharacterized protein n=1 Tax=endosymbiont of Tevnia jerichonana (vent Tica) TaxID=1049564 RepID=G2FI57_9GAMM|nr:hypothetical protein TevJSym_ba00020 [endosymbiont of Tevnia jerichonana (vent Tica)]